MPAYHIVGGNISPNAIVTATGIDRAREIYNQWLQETEGRTDNGVGVYRIDNDTIYKIEHPGVFQKM